MIEPALWSKVQSIRELRRTRTPGRIVKRNYPLRLRCSGCRRFLYGDTGRYRHPAPTCEAFIAATPTIRRRYADTHDKRVQGHSYPQSWYEDAIGELLGQVGGVDDITITEAVRLYNDRPAQVDRVTLGRIERDRDELGRHLARTRDVATWQTGMARLDGEEQLAREPAQTGRLTPPEVIAYLALATGAVGRLRPRWASSPGSGLVCSHRSDRIRTNDLSAYARSNRAWPQRRTAARVRTQGIDC
jgi:hypothetical protein